MQSGPLTIAQRQIWDLHQRLDQPSSLNMTYALAVDGPLDVRALQGSLADVRSHFEELCTTYTLENGEPVATVDSATTESVGARVARDSVVALEDVAAWLDEEESTPFSLAVEAPFRARIMCAKHGRHFLILTWHHIAVDGWSLSVLCRELSCAYKMRTQGDVRKPARRPYGCIDHARWQASWLQTTEALAQCEWWRQHLPPSGPLLNNIPGTEPTRVRTFRRQVVCWPADLTQALRTTARRASTSLFVLLLSAFEAVIAQRYQTDKVVVGTLVANRPTAASTTVLGAQYNLVLLGAELPPHSTLHDVVLGAATHVAEVLERQAVPYRAWTKTLLPRSETIPVPRVMFALDRHPLADLRFDGTTLTPVHRHYDDRRSWVRAPSPAELTFFVREGAAALTLSVFADPHVLSEQEMAALSRQYLNVVAAMVDAPETALRELPRLEDFEDCISGGHGCRGDANARDTAGCRPVDALSPPI